MSRFAKGLARTPIGNYYDPADPGDATYPSAPKRLSVTDQEAWVLSTLAWRRRVLEIGTGLGVSTRALAATAAHVTTVDPDPWVQDPDLPNVVFTRAPPDDGEFDMAFIDGLHTYGAVVADIRLCVGLGIPLLVLHDTYLDEVREAVRDCRLADIETWDTACSLAAYRGSE